MKNQFSITSFDLRVIAIMTMIIDHIGAVFYSDVSIYRIIGRISFPIFAFLIVEGSYYTSNIRSYMNRLLCFAIISEIPFNLTFRKSFISLGNANVLFTLYAGLLTIELIKRYHEGRMIWFKILLIAMTIQFIGADYKVFGILTVLIFYNYRGQFYKICIGLFLLFVTLMGGLQAYAIMALGIIYFYNGSEGRKCGRWFYLVYPIHLLIIHLVYMLDKSI